MLKKIAIGLVVLIAAVLGYAALQPDTMHIERQATIAAPPEKIYPLIDDLHRWGAWSPWEKVDPGMQRTYEGAERGKGAVYAWKGNSDIGSGRMEIVAASPPSALTIQLDFIEPMAARNVAEFRLVPEGGATRVTWSMHGPTPFLGKLIGVFVDMDHMVGQEFEKGLASLKALAEG